MKLFKKLAHAAYKSSKPAEEHVAPLAQPLTAARITTAEPLQPEEAKAILKERQEKQSAVREKLEQDYEELLEDNQRLKEKNTLLLQLVRRGFSHSLNPCALHFLTKSNDF
jgi:hypothetical protein